MTALSPHQPFGPYRVERMLGEGAMGEAFLARHVARNLPVVIKVLHPHLARKPTVVARFRREGVALQRVRHRHVVRVFEVTAIESTECIVMEYLQGASLGSYLAQTGPLPPEHLADLMIPIVEGVAAAHAAGVIHRDLKPDNIFVARDAHDAVVPKVMDFGIARLENERDDAHTATAAVLGSPAYMSPEQARSTRRANALSDQYSLGVILYEAVTGTRPFRGDSPLDVLQSVIAGAFHRPRALRPDLPESFELVILRAMAHDPMSRFADVRAFGRALLPFASLAIQAAWASTLAAPSQPSRVLSDDEPTGSIPSGWTEADTIGATDDDDPTVASAEFFRAALEAAAQRSSQPVRTDSLGASTALIAANPPPRRGFSSRFIGALGIGAIVLGALIAWRFTLSSPAPHVAAAPSPRALPTAVAPVVVATPPVAPPPTPPPVLAAAIPSPPVAIAVPPAAPAESLHSHHAGRPTPSHRPSRPPRPSGRPQVAHPNGADFGIR